MSVFQFSNPYFFKIYFFGGGVLGPNLWHMEVPRLGVKSELKLLRDLSCICIWATAMRDLSCICDPHHSSQQCQTLNPVGKGWHQTRILLDTTWVPYCWATTRTPVFAFLKIRGINFTWKKNTEGGGGKTAGKVSCRFPGSQQNRAPKWRIARFCEPHSYCRVIWAVASYLVGQEVLRGHSIFSPQRLPCFTHVLFCLLQKKGGSWNNPPFSSLGSV